MAGFREENSTK